MEGTTSHPIPSPGAIPDWLYALATWPALFSERENESGPTRRAAAWQCRKRPGPIDGLTGEPGGDNQNDGREEGGQKSRDNKLSTKRVIVEAKVFEDSLARAHH
jgi:hypothetical protein